MEKCAKCQVPVEDGTVFIGGVASVEGYNSYNFCKFCSILLEKMDRTNIFHLFLQPNSSQYEELNLSDEERNMLAARERRAVGESLWS